MLSPKEEWFRVVTLLNQARDSRMNPFLVSVLQVAERKAFSAYLRNKQPEPYVSYNLEG
jgi:Trp operon repressor